MRPRDENGRWESSYDEEVAEEICRLICTTRIPVAKLCQAQGVPHRTVLAWRKEPEFREMYTAAMETRGHALADRMLEIAEACPPDRDYVAKTKLEMDACKWHAETLARNQYGKDAAVTINNTLNAAPEVDLMTAAREIAFALELASRQSRVIEHAPHSNSKEQEDT